LLAETEDTVIHIEKSTRHSGYIYIVFKGIDGVGNSSYDVALQVQKTQFHEI
jgi:hypothetical protein